MSAGEKDSDRPLDLPFVRSQFPAFAEPTLEGFAHFENAGGSYACGQSIEYLRRHYRETRVQPYYEFPPSRRAGELMDAARRRMAAWLNVEANEVHFGPSTSQNTYVLAQALREHLQPGDEFIVTNQDHEANVGVWRRLESAGVVIREWQVDPVTGELARAGLEDLLSDRTRAVAFTHCSNVVGSMHPVRELADSIHEAGAIAIVDGVSFAPHGLPDLAALGADVYLFSLYKVYGPHLGVLCMRRELNERLPNQGHFFNAGFPSARFTPAGPDHAQIVSVNGVIDYLELLHDHHHDDPGAPLAEKGRRVARLFRQQEQELLPPLLDFVSAHPGTRLLGPDCIDNRAPTVALATLNRSPSDLSARLGEEGLGVGAGHFYAHRLVEALGLDPDEGVLRASFVHYTSAEEVAALVDALEHEL